MQNDFVHRVDVVESTNLNIRIDEEVKLQAEKIFDALGLNMTTAVIIFLRQAIRENGIPFEVKLNIPNETTAASVPEQSVTPPSLREAPMPEQPEIEEFTVTPAALTLAVGEMFDLKPSMSCTWSCDNPAVATIGGAQGRTVTALSAGSCTITARSSDGQIFYITVSVSE